MGSGTGLGVGSQHAGDLGECQPVLAVISGLESALNGADGTTEDWDVLVEAGGWVPEILMEGDAALFIEAELGDADGADGLAFLELREFHVHDPADVGVAAGDGDVFDGGLDFFRILGGFQEVFLNGFVAANGFERVVEEGVGGVGGFGFGADAVGGEVGEEFLETLNAGFGGRTARCG